MIHHIALQVRRTMLLAIATVLGFVGLASAFLPSLVSAAPTITQRALTSTSARPGQTTQLAWTFNTTADAGNAKTIEIEFCDLPLGACTKNNTPTIGTPAATLSGPWTTNAVTSTTKVNSRTTPASIDTQIDIVKTNADNASTKTGLVITLGATDITNKNTANMSYYTRVRIYADNPATDLKWEGVFAQSTSQTLTVNARVQERLDFCVGATQANAALATTFVPTSCATIGGTSVDIGNVEGGTTNVSPVLATNGGSNTNGLAMVRTNAVNGVVVDYKSILDNSSGTLKVPSAACSDGVAPPVAVSTIGTDQCFNSSTTPAVIAGGAEKFGMVVAGINCESTTAYTCTFSSGLYNLVRDVDYDGAGAPNDTFVTDTDQIPTTLSQYAWDATGTADRIASSTSSSVKVVDDEAMILKFAATAGITTPTGSYTVQADFIATATF